MTTVPRPTRRNRQTEQPTADFIAVRGARTHNLAGLDVDLPLGKLTTISGVSGSGKSSLAFDTLYAEGLHRYLATVSSHLRDLLQRVERPQVDRIDGLPPTLGLEQRHRGPRRRTTVATISGIYDYLRLLFARLGHLHCPTCSQPVQSQSRESIVKQVLSLDERRKVLILAPLVRAEPGTHTEVLARMVKDGFVRARVDGELIDLSDPPALAAHRPHSLEVVVDRLVIKEGIQPRVEESIDLALQIAQGQCILSHEADGRWIDRLYSSRLACLDCGVSFPSLEPGDFSFNSPRGACPTCQGLGVCESPTGDEFICPDCAGARLALLPRRVLIRGTSLGDLLSWGAKSALEWLTADEASAEPGDESETRIRAHVIPEIAGRLEFLIALGLDYLTLNRAGESLSAGEFQRARLTAGLGGKLTGVCYVIDEPTAGLHACDTPRLVQTLATLRDQGNTLIVVEHDLAVIRESDFTIEVGPGAGPHGGQLVAACPPRDLVNHETSLTGQELRRRARGLPAGATEPPSRWLTVSGASLHNLRGITAEFPLERLVCVTGVSGSGKTSLVLQTLVPSVRAVLARQTPKGGVFGELHGTDRVKRLVQIDQRPLGRSDRGTPATYAGLWDEVRRVFARTREARLRGFTARRFSLQSAEGRCGRCAGRGRLRVERSQLADWSARCPECGGARFNAQTLSVRYRGQSAADVLEMTFEEAAAFFANHPRLQRPLALFTDLGLGYLRLGQSARTLSGGEAQRVTLASELWKSDPTVPALFVLDEPTAGLHAVDVQQLLAALKGLVRAGNTVVVIEHHLDVIAASDWIIDLGPGPGPEGGRIVVAGPPETVVSCAASRTGEALRSEFGSANRRPRS